MHILILFNPNSGKRNGHIHARRIERALLKRDATTQVTKQPSPSIGFLNDFWAHNKEEFSSVVIIGGDGTIGPVINAMFKHSFHKTPIYCYGRGTANDFASFFKTNRGARRAAKIILAGKCRDVDTLYVNGKQYACNVACGGAFTNGVTRYSKKAKFILGKLAYAFVAFAKTFKLQNQRMRFTVDEGTFEVNIFLFYILNTKNVGGLKNCSPLSDAGDGMLDLLCLRYCGLWGKMSLAFHQAFGRLHHCRYVKHVQGTHFRVEHVPDHPIKSDFIVTDIDGNGYKPYPLEVAVGKRVRVLTKK